MLDTPGNMALQAWQLENGPVQGVVGDIRVSMATVPPSPKSRNNLTRPLPPSPVAYATLPGGENS